MIIPSNEKHLYEYEEQARMIKLLAHPVRLAILDLLRNGEQCVCHMEAALGMRQAYISQQLMVLRENAIIDSRRDGWNMYYRAIEPRIYTIIDAVQLLTSPSSTRLTAISCVCPKCTA